ncbi:MAG: NFACT RNA binding domain-containing protein, partial [Bacillota bacterium]|nr:NFACT RNA binding domain-containing protein [Bacillota bacterium]
YYRRYAKAKKARGSIQKQLEQNYRERDYLLSIDQALNDCSSMEELLAVEREATAAGYHKTGSTEKNASHLSEKRSPALPPRKILSRDGFTILIGRNNRQNDRLSLNQASEHDIWLHAQKMPGSHVIIVTHGQTVPEETLSEAAAYAAWFSKGRDSNRVPVDYLPAGKLRKPPGSHPGYVIFSGQRTLYVQPREPQELPEGKKEQAASGSFSDRTP